MRNPKQFFLLIGVATFLFPSLVFAVDLGFSTTSTGSGGPMYSEASAYLWSSEGGPFNPYSTDPSFPYCLQKGSGGNIQFFSASLMVAAYVYDSVTQDNQWYSALCVPGTYYVSTTTSGEPVIGYSDTSYPIEDENGNVFEAVLITTPPEPPVTYSYAELYVSAFYYFLWMFAMGLIGALIFVFFFSWIRW